MYRLAMVGCFFVMERMGTGVAAVLAVLAGIAADAISAAAAAAVEPLLLGGG